MDALLGQPIPPETEATCSRCAMMAQPGVSPLDPQSCFHPEVACCTFFPTLPNFMVGNVLSGRADDTPVHHMVSGRARDFAEVSPFGVCPPATYWLRYRQNPGGFGRDLGMRCPYAVPTAGGVRCAIWKHRESTCATWFCKYSRGEVGQRFWVDLFDLLRGIEHSLAWWCILRSGFQPRTLAALSRLDVPGRTQAPARGETIPPGPPLRPEDAPLLWGPWLGREAEFFRRAARLVRRLSWNEVVAIGGATAEARARIVRDSFAALVRFDLPERATPATIGWAAREGDRSIVIGYSANQPVSLPKRVLAVLHYFSGRTVPDALAEIEARERLRLAPGLVRRLIDLRILEPDDAAPPQNRPKRATGPRQRRPALPRR
jgi:hypothetical protein